MNITVLISHWPRHVDRFDYFVATVHSLFKYLPDSTAEHSFRYLVYIEQSMSASQQLLNAVTSYCRHRHIDVVLNVTAAGVGKSLNTMLERVETPYVLYFQDDFELMQPLPLDYDVDVLESDNLYSLVRYAAHERTLASARTIQTGPTDALPLRVLDREAFYYWSFNPFLAQTDALRGFFGPFPDQRDAENLMNQKLRAISASHRILVRGPGTIGGDDCLVRHIGEKTSILEKFDDVQLGRQFGDQVPPRRPESK